MYKHSIFILLALILTGCKTVKVPHINLDAHNTQPMYYTLSSVVVANDLSEDASGLSTQNDETITILYDYTDLENIRLISASTSTFTHDVTERYSSSGSTKETTRIAVVLIEMDTERTIHQIEPIVRLNFDKLNLDWINHDNRAIAELLNDDDLLGIRIGDLPKLDKKLLIHFEGYSLYDYYSYTFGFKQKLTQKED